MYSTGNCLLHWLTDLSDRASKVSKDMDKTSNDVKALDRSVDDIENNIQNSLIPKFNQIKNVRLDEVFENIENSSKLSIFKMVIHSHTQSTIAIESNKDMYLSDETWWNSNLSFSFVKLTRLRRMWSRLAPLWREWRLPLTEPWPLSPDSTTNSRCSGTTSNRLGLRQKRWVVFVAQSRETSPSDM